VLTNLLSNAVKFTETGEVAVRVRMERSRVRFEVTDTGIGISPADQSRLFTRFFRTRDAETRAIQGIGLGLAITRSIVEAHGGTIRVESRVGSGTRFLVRLPRCGPVPAPGGALGLIVDEGPGRIASRRPVPTNSAVL
jgi:signal transduction histidine kinase